MADKTFTTEGIVTIVLPVIAGTMFFALPHLCNVKRRVETPSKNVLNEPDYGKSKDWANIYVNLPCRLEISSSKVQFAPTGLRVPPINRLYVDASTPLKVMDRVYFNPSVSGLGVVQEFIVQGAMPALDMVGQPSHHLEYELIIP
jgi:hypothetical protein